MPSEMRHGFLQSAYVIDTTKLVWTGKIRVRVLTLIFHEYNERAEARRRPLTISESVELTVRQAKYDDVYTDIVRVNKDNRNGVREGRICRVSILGGESGLFAVRGLPDKDGAIIRLDEVGRDKLNLKEGDRCRFTFDEADYFDAIRWACRASDPAARIAVWIALVFGLSGLAFGIVGVILGIAALNPSS